MPVTFKNQRTNISDSYVYLPSSTAVGDLIVIFVGQNSGTFTAPSGYSTVVARSSSTSTYVDSIGIFYKIATSSDVPNQQIFVPGSMGNGYYQSSIVAIFTGFNPTNPIAGFGVGESSTSVVTATYNTTLSSRKFFFASQMNFATSNVPTFTMQTAGHTEQVTVPSGNYRRMSLYEKSGIDSPGTAPSVNFTSNFTGSMNGVSVSIAEGNAAPVASNLQPFFVARDPRIPQNFTWTATDAFGDAQTSYQIQYRERGSTGAWTQTAVINSSATTHTFAANTFTLEKVYEWQIRLADALAGQGAWSNPVFFTAAVDMWSTGAAIVSSTTSGTIPGIPLLEHTFETDAPNWESNSVFGTFSTSSFVRNTTRAKTGTYALEVTWGAGLTWVNTILSGQTIVESPYVIEADIYVPAGSPDVYLDPVFNIAKTPRQVVTQKDQWVTVSQTFWATQTDIYMGVIKDAAATAGTKCFIDNFKVLPITTTMSAGTYIAEVRTADASGEWSPWSARADFAVNAPPTKPTNITLTPTRVGGNINVTWTYSDPEGNTQNKYQIQYRKIS